MNEAEIVDVALGILIEVQSTVSFIFVNFIYVYMLAVLGPRCCSGLGACSLVAVRVSHCGGFSYCGAQAPGHMGLCSWQSMRSGVVVPGPSDSSVWALDRTGFCSCGTWLSCPEACGVFPDQGLNLYLLHWQMDFSPLTCQGSPAVSFLMTGDSWRGFMLIKEAPCLLAARSPLICSPLQGRGAPAGPLGLETWEAVAM